MRYVALFLLAALCMPVGASSVLQGIYSDFSSNQNLTTPKSYQDQQAGYATGGGLVVRTRNTQVNPFNLSMPRMNVGCGKIDAFFGSISFIQKEELVRLLQNVGSGALTYAFQLGMKTLSPEIEGLLSELRETIMKMNALELDSCQMGMNLVGGALPKGSKAEEIHCKNLQMSGGEDSFGARESCKDLNKVAENVSAMKTKEENQDVLQGEYNLTWHIAKKLNFDDETAKFALSALGSIISKREGERFRVTSHRGFGAEEDFLEGYLKGGVQVDGYACVDGECKDIQKQRVTISQQSSLLSYFQRWVGEMMVSYRSNNMPSSRSEETVALLIDASSLPLLRYIEVSQATGVVGLLDEALEYMARQILIRRIERLSLEIKTALSAMAKIQLDDTVTENFKDQLDKITESLKAQGRAFRRDSMWRLEQELKAHEMSVKSMKGA